MGEIIANAGILLVSMGVAYSTYGVGSFVDHLARERPCETAFVRYVSDRYLVGIDSKNTVDKAGLEREIRRFPDGGKAIVRLKRPLLGDLPLLGEYAPFAQLPLPRTASKSVVEVKDATTPEDILNFLNENLYPVSTPEQEREFPKEPSLTGKYDITVRGPVRGGSIETPHYWTHIYVPARPWFTWQEIDIVGHRADSE
ncbi:MAG: hypothetical protein ACE5ES_03425 [Candidatus Nanoarchaeia archaeon]